MQIEMILIETKKPIYIYLYNSEEDDFEKENIAHALKTFRKLQIQYRNKITFAQIDSKIAKHLYQPLGVKASDTFMGIFNDCLYGPVYCYDEWTYKQKTNKIEEIVGELENLAKTMSGIFLLKFHNFYKYLEEEYLSIESVLAYKELDNWYNKPCFLAFYTSLDVAGMKTIKKFNSLYQQYKDKVDFLKVESTKAYTRYKLTKKDLPTRCTRKEIEETFRKMEYAGYCGDLNDGMKVFTFLPSFVGYFKGTQFEKIGFC